MKRAKPSGVSRYFVMRYQETARYVYETTIEASSAEEAREKFDRWRAGEEPVKHMRECEGDDEVEIECETNSLYSLLAQGYDAPEES